MSWFVVAPALEETDTSQTVAAGDLARATFRRLAARFTTHQGDDQFQQHALYDCNAHIVSPGRNRTLHCCFGVVRMYSPWCQRAEDGHCSYFNGHGARLQLQ